MKSDSPAGDTTTPVRSGTSDRLLSLDAFRGLVIVLMFLVNVAGNDPAFPSWFPHFGWNNGRMGSGLADYVFPWFLFIVGVAIPISMNSGRGRGMAWWRKLGASLRRGATIYLLGTLIWCAFIAYKPADPAARWLGPIDWRVLLHWDILPLIGLAYFVGVALYLPGGRGGVVARLVFVGGVLAFKWWTLQGATPAQHATWIEALEARASLDHAIKRDLAWLGVLVTQGLPASAVVVLGSFAGDVLRAEASPWTRAMRLTLGGGAILILGAVWSLFGFWTSKDFFSSTYVMVTAGSAAVTLGVTFWIVDAARWTSLTALRVLGLNALAVYVLAEFLWKTVMTRWEVALPESFGAGASAWLITSWKAWLQAGFGNGLGAWLHVALYILAYWLVALWLYTRKIFVKV